MRGWKFLRSISLIILYNYHHIVKPILSSDLPSRQTAYETKPSGYGSHQFSPVGRWWAGQKVQLLCKCSKQAINGRICKLKPPRHGCITNRPRPVDALVEDRQRSQVSIKSISQRRNYTKVTIRAESHMETQISRPFYF